MVILGIGLFLIGVKNLVAPTPRQIVRRHVGASPSPGGSVRIQETKGAGFFAGSETFLSFRVESNAFHRIVREKHFGEIRGPFFRDNINTPWWFDGVRSQSVGYIRLSTNRWFFVGPRRRHAEFLCRDENNNAFYCRTWAQ